MATIVKLGWKYGDLQTYHLSDGTTFTSHIEHKVGDKVIVTKHPFGGLNIKVV